MDMLEAAVIIDLELGHIIINYKDTVKSVVTHTEKRLNCIFWKICTVSSEKKAGSRLATIQKIIKTQYFLDNLHSF